MPDKLPSALSSVLVSFLGRSAVQLPQKCFGLIRYIHIGQKRKEILLSNLNLQHGDLIPKCCIHSL